MFYAYAKTWPDCNRGWGGGLGIVGTPQLSMLWRTAKGRSANKALNPGFSSKVRDLLTILSKGMIGSVYFRNAMLNAEWRVCLFIIRIRPTGRSQRPETGKMERREWIQRCGGRGGGYNAAFGETGLGSERKQGLTVVSGFWLRWPEREWHLHQDGRYDGGGWGAGGPSLEGEWKGEEGQGPG